MLFSNKKKKNNFDVGSDLELFCPFFSHSPLSPVSSMCFFFLVLVIASLFFSTIFFLSQIFFKQTNYSKTNVSYAAALLSFCRPFRWMSACDTLCTMMALLAPRDVLDNKRLVEDGYAQSLPPYLLIFTTPSPLLRNYSIYFDFGTQQMLNPS